ncbi:MULTISPECIES: CD1375 family protein [Streptococcus]|uniref:CD1375-like domain-containing protein n=2 Tax=Streptococcus TaxID=1301 RepID=A0AAE9R484_STREQ|nr:MULTISPECIES: hypothetical protein [Streptococcus]MDV6022162.1 hypothetical protein [Streptococcus canis]GFK30743.1 hypothetical protein ScFU149_08600 [Streptococcus canis]VTT17396.1 Uncharacterised protein [Streptococcus dysgalactiae]VTT23401.1 Uncharacterised protein [Streptococcus dysgalactiae subsp. equisimilis]
MKTLQQLLAKAKAYLLQQRSIDMMIKLFAINIVEGRFPFNKVPTILKAKVKEQIVLIVGDDNQELIKELTESKEE